MNEHIHASVLELPIIDLRRCTGCGLCQSLCPTAAVKVRNGKAEIVYPEQCTFCEVCETYCPVGAIGRPFTIGFAPGVATNASSSTDLY